jgi:hypothetical protein
VGENPDSEREEVPGRPAISSESMREQEKEGREQQAEEGRGILPRGYGCSSGGFSGASIHKGA